MSFLRRVRSLAWRGVKALFKLLYLVIRAVFILLMLIIPIPILLKPEITNPYRRNQVTQVEKKKVPD
jgi:hypothetical protein